MVADRVSIAGNHLQLGLDGMVLGLQHGRLLALSVRKRFRSPLIRRHPKGDKSQKGKHLGHSGQEGFV